MNLRHRRRPEHITEDDSWVERRVSDTNITTGVVQAKEHSLNHQQRAPHPNDQVKPDNAGHLVVFPVVTKGEYSSKVSGPRWHDKYRLDREQLKIRCTPTTKWGR